MTLRSLPPFTKPFLAFVAVLGVLLSPSIAFADVNSPTEIFIANSSPYALISSNNGDYVYFVDNSRNVAVRVSTATNVVASVAVGDSPQAISESRDGTKVYVSNSRASTISVVDVATWSVTNTWALTSNSWPMQSASSLSGNYLYVTTQIGEVYRVDSSTGASTTLSTGIVGMSFGMLLSPDGTRLYVLDYNANRVSVMNASTGVITANVAVGQTPQYGQLSSNGGILYVANEASGSISVIDTSSLTVTSTFATAVAPRFLSLSPDGTTLAIGSYSNSSVVIMNSANGATQQTFNASNLTTSSCMEGVAFTPNGASLWAGGQCAHRIYRWAVNPPLYTPAPTPTPTPSSTTAPTLSSTGLDAAPYFLISGALVGGGVIALAVALVLRRRLPGKSE